MLTQKSFNPVDYEFYWTANWYRWERREGTRLALKARNELAKRHKQAGRRVRKHTMRDQLISRGGIGSGHPHLDFVVNVYVLDVYEEKDGE